jgi:hypothetical protein
MVAPNEYSGDMECQSQGNYIFDAIGNLIHDQAEQIDIVWNNAGKIVEIRPFDVDAEPKPALEFRYDAMGQRVAKILKPRSTDGSIKSQLHWIETHYVYEASGNALAVYERTHEALGGTHYREIITMKEQHLYGSARLGMLAAETVVSKKSFSAGIAATTGQFINYQSLADQSGNTLDPLVTTINAQGNTATTERFARTLGRRMYELSNHLGNVLAVISDRKVGVDNFSYIGSVNGNYTLSTASPNTYQSTPGVGTHTRTLGPDGRADLYTAEIISSREYSAYGAELPGYSYTTFGEYRYQFQNQEVDEEFWGGAVSYKYRIEDARLGRFFSVDPLAPKYAYNSPYAFSENRVIDGVELEGLEYQKAGKYENDLYVLPQDNLVNRYNHLEYIKLDYEKKEQEMNLKSPKSIVDHFSPPAQDEKNLVEPKVEIGMGSGPKVPDNVLPEIVKYTIEEGLKLGVSADQEGLNLQLTSLSLAFPYFYDTKEGGVKVTETSSGIDIGVFGAEKTVINYSFSVLEKPDNYLLPVLREYKVMSVQKGVELGPVARETISTYLKMPSWKSYDLIRFEERYGLGKNYGANFKVVSGSAGAVIWSPWKAVYYRD